MQDHRYREPRRARRIRDRERMIAKGARIAARCFGYDRPDNARCFHWTDLKGRPRLGLPTWEDVFEIRRQHGVVCHDHLAACSCAMCGNPRRWFAAPTLKEEKARLSAEEQIAEALGADPRRPRLRLGW
jgi:hypothetical protein